MSFDASGNEDGRNESSQDVSQVSHINELLQQWDRLLSELENFQAFLKKRELEHTVELRRFQSRILAERRKLEKLDPRSPKTAHAVNSTNFPFYDAVWAAAKASRGLVQINKRVYWGTTASHLRAKRAVRKKASALVDIVADNGAEWVKVSAITANRLLFEKAKAGWESDDDDWSGESGDEQDGGKVTSNGSVLDPASIPAASTSGAEGDDDAIGLLKMALDLQRTSRCTFVRYSGKHPRVRFVLPRIHAGAIPEVDAILNSVRETGAIVQCAQDLLMPESGSDSEEQRTSLESVFERLLIDPHAHLTSTINIDCTVLLALVSDLSHAKVEPEPWFSGAIKRQLQLEAKEQLLPRNLWPAICGREMVCTTHAAKRMREIVETLATPTERARVELLLGEGELGTGKTGQDLVEDFQRFSIHSVPKDWKLPIEVVEGEVNPDELSQSSKRAWAELSPINRSVFLWGWASDYTTFTSNGTVARLIKRIAEADVDEEDVEGPRIWLCETARSLVGKEKRTSS